MPKETKYFPALTGLRAIAALLVFFNHQSWFIHYGSYADRLHNELHIGVGIFFVLSGFLIHWHNLELHTENKFNIKEYLVKRWARIYPLWFILTLFTFLFILYQCQWECFSLRKFLLNLSFTQAYFNDALFSGIAQGWSLCVEAIFYILAIWMVLNRKYIFWMVPVGLIIGVLWLVIGNNFPQFNLLDTMEEVLMYTFLGRALEFIAGAYLAEILFQKKNIKAFNFPLYTTIGGIGIGALPFLLTIIVPGDTSSIYNLNGVIIQIILMAIFGTLLLLGLNTEKSWLQKLLSTKIMEYAGKASFAFYLIHIGVFQEYIYFHFPHWMEFPLLCLASAFLYSFIEAPLRKFIILSSGKL